MANLAALGYYQECIQIEETELVFWQITSRRLPLPP
jgi:hypothetical protein